MAIRYEISAKDNTMFVLASGVDEDLEDVKRYGMAVIAHALQFRCNRILCNELNLNYDLNVADTFESARFIAEQVPELAQVAIVYQPTFKTDARFWESVATHRGLTVRFFQSLAAAHEWLGLPAPHPPDTP